MLVFSFPISKSVVVMYQVNAVRASQGVRFLPLHFLVGPVDIRRTFSLGKKNLTQHTYSGLNPWSTELHADQSDSHFLA